MFTGLIEDIGTVRNLTQSPEGMRVEIATAIDTAEIALGDSIACDGPCLTVVAKETGRFTVELSYETVQRSTWKSAAIGQRVNLERALKLGDRLGGHIVSGHVDGVGRIARRETRGRAENVHIHCDGEILRYVVEKGSIAIDGISLTVNAVDRQGFLVTLIPHTQGETTLSARRVGDRVNLECDVLGKYVEKLLMKDGKLDRDFLAKHGFLT